MPRLFTGVEIPPDVGQALATLRGGLPGARWIDPENYHLTLRFIGDVDDNIAHEVASMLGRVKRGSFELYMEGLTSFGGRKPRAVVASVAHAQALLDVQAEQERLMQRIGLEPEGRKFTPHVTLARLRESSSQQVAEYLSARGYDCTSRTAVVTLCVSAIISRVSDSTVKRGGSTSPTTLPKSNVRSASNLLAN